MSPFKASSKLHPAERTPWLGSAASGPPSLASPRFGSSLLRGGARPGDVLCLVMANTPEWPIVFLGAVGAGLTVSTLRPSHRPEEVARLLENCLAR